MLAAVVVGSATLAGPAGAATYVYENPTPITINDATAPGILTPASPSPSTIQVPYADFVDRPTVSVRLRDVSHTNAADIRVVLVAPGADWDPLSTRTLLQNAGGDGPVSGATLTFVDTGALIPFAGPMESGVFRNSVYDELGNAQFRTVWGPTFSGSWSLYVSDDEPSDTGVIAGGWAIELTATPQVVKPPP
ncbi:MAG TPA: hypothetical protein VNT22_00470, partial [Baekduia sp.]|nr:hypothetical protein [Baekduia sp.]